MQPQRTVVLAEPVYPADSPARSNHSMSRAGSTSGDLGAQGAPVHPFPDICCGVVIVSCSIFLASEIDESLDWLHPFWACGLAAAIIN